MSTSSGSADASPSGGISVEHAEELCVVTLWGEVDLTVRAEAPELIRDAVGEGVPIAVDVDRVTFMDSTGLSALVQLASRARDLGIPVVIRRPSRVVTDLLSLTGADRLLPVEPAD